MRNHKIDHATLVVLGAMLSALAGGFATTLAVFALLLALPDQGEFWAIGLFMIGGLGSGAGFVAGIIGAWRRPRWRAVAGWWIAAFLLLAVSLSSVLLLRGVSPTIELFALACCVLSVAIALSIIAVLVKTQRRTAQIMLIIFGAIVAVLVLSSILGPLFFWLVNG